MHLAFARSDGEPWWWRHVDHDAVDLEIDYTLVVDTEGRPRRILSWRFWKMCLGTLRGLFRARRDGHQYIITGECDWTTFIIAGWQTVFLMRRPRHIIVQFIMREKTTSLQSRAKYAFMKWCFSSVAMCICSSQPESDYYARAFGWPSTKLGYVPFHTDPEFLDLPVVDPEEGGYAVAAGRTFRDYKTVIEAFRGIDVPLTIVGYTPDGTTPIPPNVTVHKSVPLAELTALIARSSIVIVPLEEREISTGQSVLLQAMAMRKAVVVTRLNGTVDYIEHMRTGVFVPPRDVGALREAVLKVAGDSALRRRLGTAARDQIRRAHLLTHYLQGVSEVVERRFGRQ